MRTVHERRASTILYRLAMGMSEEAGIFLLPSNVCWVVPLTLLVAGRPFEFVDVDEQTLCMSESLLHQRLGDTDAPRVAGILFVRTYGVDGDATDLFRGLKRWRQDLLLIDDRCLCRPQPDVEELEPQGADVVLYSTGYAKQVDLDHGGFAHLDECVPYSRRDREYAAEDLERAAEICKTHISAASSIYRQPGDTNEHDQLRRLRWLDTAPASTSWEDYRQQILERRLQGEAHRTRLNTIYSESIPEGARLPAGFHDWRFQLRVPEPKDLLREIFAAGFFASDHFFPAAMLFGGHPCKVATALHAGIVNLFNDFRVTASDAGAIAAVVNRHLDRQPLLRRAES